MPRPALVRKEDGKCDEIVTKKVLADFSSTLLKIILALRAGFPHLFPCPASVRRGNFNEI